LRNGKKVVDARDKPAHDDRGRIALSGPAFHDKQIDGLASGAVACNIAPS
jgi:hypothetical protein